MKVVVIVPTYNEKDNIKELIKQIFDISKKVKNHTIHILVVDDESPDGTGEVVKKLQKKYSKKLHLITGKKEGLGRAYLRGMDYASKELKAKVMFEMDADFQHDPKEIPNFLKKIDDGYDLVVGSRYISGGSIPANWGIDRIIYSVLGNLVVRTILFHFEHHDWTTGYRAIRTPIYKKVRKDLESFKGYTFQVSFLHKAFINGAKVTETPIKFIDRVHGESKIGSVDYIFNLFKYLISETIKNPPRQLRFILVGGSSFLLQASLFGILKDRIDLSFVANLDQNLAFLKGFGSETANAIGFTAAVTNNFFSNNFFTFSDRSKPLNIRLVVSYIKFFGLSLFSLGLQTAIIFLTGALLGESNFSDWLGFILGVGIGLFVNYFFYSTLVWKKK